MWYAVGMDDGIRSSHRTKHELLKNYQCSQPCKRIGAGCYQLDLLDRYAMEANTIYIGRRADLIAIGFGHYFEEETK